MKFRSRYSERVRVTSNTEGESLTQQQFKEECDIRNILKRYEMTGLVEGNPGEPLFDDVSNLPDFQASMNSVARTTEYFESLPARTRLRFDNDPMALVSFLQDPANRDEAEDLGLIAKRVVGPSEGLDEASTVTPAVETKKEPTPEE